MQAEPAVPMSKRNMPECMFGPGLYRISRDPTSPPSTRPFDRAAHAVTARRCWARNPGLGLFSRIRTMWRGVRVSVDRATAYLRRVPLPECFDPSISCKFAFKTYDVGTLSVKSVHSNVLPETPIAVLESSVGFVHDSRPHSNDPIMSLRGVELRSNFCIGQLEIASGFALAMTVFESFRVIKTDTTFENPNKWCGRGPVLPNRQSCREKFSS